MVNTYYFDGSGGVTSEWTEWRLATQLKSSTGFNNPSNILLKDGNLAESSSLDFAYFATTFEFPGSSAIVTAGGEDYTATSTLAEHIIEPTDDGQSSHQGVFRDNFTSKEDLSDLVIVAQVDEGSSTKLIRVNGITFPDMPSNATLERIRYRIRSRYTGGIFEADYLEVSVRYSVDGISDPDNAWSNPSNAFDGDTGTFASVGTEGSTTSNYLEGIGTTTPSSGSEIIQVRARLGVSFGSYVTLSEPTGGWTWSKLQGLATRIWNSSQMSGQTHADIYLGDDIGGTSLGSPHRGGVSIAIVELEVTSEATPDIAPGIGLMPGGAGSGMLGSGMTAIYADASSATASHTTDSLIYTENTDSHTTNSLIYTQNTDNHTTDSLIVESNALTHATDSLIRDSGTNTHNTDSLVLESLSDSHTNDSLVIESQESTHTTDSFVQDATIAVHTTDSLIIATESTSHSTDSAISGENDVIHSTDSLIKEQLENYHSTDSLVKTTEQTTHSSDSLLVDSFTTSHTADSLISEIQIRTTTHTTDSLVYEIATDNHLTDSLVKELLTKNHTTDSFIYLLEEVSHSTDSNVIASETTSHSTDSRIAGPPFVPVPDDTTQPYTPVSPSDTGTFAPGEARPRQNYQVQPGTDREDWVVGDDPSQGNYDSA